MVDVIRGLASFAARPPTPPRERNDTITNLASDNNPYFNNLIQQAVLDTPDDSPSSSGEYFGVSSDKGSKRVVFSPWTKYHKPLSLGSKNAVSEGQIRPLPPSRDCQSSKSILKPYIETAATADTKEAVAVDLSDTPTMLRSATQHLASASRSSRLDAYMAILGCLSTYDDIPDTQALAERLLELTEFIRRDISARMDATGAPDTQLATQALKLLTTLLCTGTLGELIPEDFSSFIMDRCISVIEDQEMPKILVSHYMNLLIRQNFSSKVMSNDRISRLLSALDKVANRVNGNRVVCHRLMIYQRLLTQSKSLMKLRVGDWMDHLVAGMLSTFNEIRSRAIVFGLEAGLALGTTSTVSQACVDMFNRKSPEGRKVVDFLISRLNEMAARKEDGIHVPQIWSVAILFLRSRRRQVERWEHLKPWLMIIQLCFNSSDHQVKLEANIAWNRLVFAVNPDTSTSPSMVRMLRQPIVSQLDRKNSDKHPRHAEKVARSTYCNLLYYAFRPVPTHAQLDQFWEEYVSPVIPSNFSASKSDLNHACGIMAALFGGTTPKVWDENRANTGGPTKPEDLPCLDPKWIRQRAATILKTFDRILDIADWQLDTEEKAPILLAWRSFTTAVGEAGNKEVKVSMESLTAVAQILTTIKHFWDRSLKRQEAAKTRDLSQTIQKVGLLINEAVSKIGSMPFIEKRLVQSSQDTFEAAETPSSRLSRRQGPLNSPILHLLNMVISGVGHDPVSQAYRDSIGSLVQIALESATSRRSRLGVLRDIARLLSTEGEHQWPAKVYLWQLIAEATKSAIKVPVSIDNHNDSPQHVGHDYREAIKILEAGLQQKSVENLDAWLSLSNAIVDLLHKEVGDGGVILVFTEPLAHAMVRENSQVCDDFLLDCAIALLETVSWPQSRQVMERAQKVLWGTSSHKPQSLDPFSNLYTMVDTLLGTMYRQLESEASATMTRFLAAVTSLISLCPLSLKLILLKRIQQGLGLWVEDAKGLMTQSGSETTLNKVYAETKKLWAAVSVAIKELPKADNGVLIGIQALIVSSLTSRHQAILNQSIELWNCTFGNADFLEYRDDLRTALAKLRSVTDMQLPNFPEDDIEVMSSPIHFIDSQDSVEDPPDLPVRDIKERRAVQSDTTPRPPTKSLLLSSANSRKTPSRRSAEKKTTPTARLRHNDSQVHFAAIPSSSPLAPNIDDSQLLTERQKEVKERQRCEAAAVFPDIRSSSRSRSRNGDRKSPPKLVLSVDHRSQANPYVGDDSSPMLPSDDALMKDVLGSSPTPRSNKRVTLDLGSDFEPPSSPPTAPSVVAADPQLDPSPTPAAIVQGQDQSTTPEENNLPDTKKVPLPHEEPVSFPYDEGLSTSEPFETAIGSPNPKPVAGTANASHHSHADVLPFSDVNMFVDTPSEPAVEILAAGSRMERNEPNFLSSLQGTAEVDAEPKPDRIVQQVATPLISSDTPTKAQEYKVSPQEYEISGVIDSFYDGSTSFYSNEDDQIAAQLVNDLERASQQGSPQKNEQTGATSQSKKRGRKRKIEYGSLRRNSKRVKSLPSAPGIEVIVETRKPGDMNDCVVVDSRRALDSASPLPQEVKREQSPSPSSDVRAVTKAHEAKVDPIRRTRSSMAGAPFVENLLPRSRKRKATTDKVKAEGGADAEDVLASPNRRRRSAGLSQASVDGPQVQGISSAEDYKTGVFYDRLTTGLHSSDRNSNSQSGSHGESMDQEQDANHFDAFSQQDRERSNRTPQGSGTACSGVADVETSPPLATEALSPALRTRPRQSRTREADSPRVAGSVESSLGEEGHNPKRQAMDTARDVQEQDLAMPQDVKPEAPHAARSSAPGLLGSLRQWIGDVKRAVLEPEEEREIVGLMFESIQEVHEAGRRNAGR